ncbi:DUF805 domain-containing protein [Helicobacter sp. 11S02596-1]|uniref:DUF805 domain-containing protein n=1 Tax=Helicobacter sp. 11S02596-1 TaxID=1476194 RepID=UPI000BA67618|nr:DUF805 domain-containing protein [Helicobacter sp. 11S02596-1]PAF42464.1 hypothetical protein BJI48_06580 [Helicobacter sp. 11S02596-1]
MYWFLRVLKQYAVFSGRARRKEFWIFFLFYAVVAAVLQILAKTITPLSMIFSLISLAWTLGTLLPLLGVMIRRLHDTQRSGWWILIGAIPIIGPIVLLVFTAQKGTSGSNAYGDDPLAGDKD